MPKVFEILGYLIYFWSDEEKPLEPLHVHVAHKPTKNGTKIWILSVAPQFRIGAYRNF